MYSARLISVFVVGALALSCKQEPAPKVEASTASSAARPASESKRVPLDKIYAGSAHVRVVDAAAGVVSARIDLSRAITGFAFTRDGKRGYVSASDGVYAIDTAKDELLGKLTDHPARSALLDPTGTKLFVLEHEVVVDGQGGREVLPFRLVTVDTLSGKVLSDEEIGPRITFAYPSTPSNVYHVVAGESGLVTVGTGKYAEGEPLPVRELVHANGPFRVRGEAAIVAGTRAYLPVEASRAAVLEVDLTTGRAQPIDLERPIQTRGLALAPDGKTLYVDAVSELIAVDLAKRAPRAALEVPGAHTGLALSSDGTWAYMAQTIHEGGGAISIIDLTSFAVRGKIHLDDISPWALGLRP